MPSNKEDPIPEWQQNLQTIPKSELCPTQRDLLRCLELQDLLLKSFKHANTPNDLTVSERFKIILAALEIQYRAILGMDILELQSTEVYRAIYWNGVIDSAFLGGEALSKALNETLEIDDWTLTNISPKEVLNGMACGLMTCIHNLHYDKLTDDMKWACASHMENLLVVLSMLGSIGGDAILEEEGSTLTCQDLYNMDVLLRSWSAALANKGSRIKRGTIDAIEDLTKHLESGKPCWYMFF